MLFLYLPYAHAQVTGNKTPDSSNSSSSEAGAPSSETTTSSISETVTPGEEDRIDITKDFDSQTEEDFSSNTNVIDVSTIEDGETKKIADDGTSGKENKCVTSASGKHGCGNESERTRQRRLYTGLVLQRIASRFKNIAACLDDKNDWTILLKNNSE